MSDCHKKKCPKKRSCCCKVVLVLLGGLLLLALIFCFKDKERDQQPNSTFYPFGKEFLALTPEDNFFVIYENAEPQPILVSFFNVEIFATEDCEFLVTMENENAPALTRTLKGGISLLDQSATLVSKEATKVTVEATFDADAVACGVTIFGANGTNFSSF